MDYKNPFFLSVLDKGYNSQQKAIEDAINFLKEGDSPEKVSRCIGLPLEKVIELQKQIDSKV